VGRFVDEINSDKASLDNKYGLFGLIKAVTHEKEITLKGGRFSTKSLFKLAIWNKGGWLKNIPVLG
jgi:hypothetical protein